MQTRVVVREKHFYWENIAILFSLRNILKTTFFLQEITNSIIF